MKVLLVISILFISGIIVAQDVEGPVYVSNNFNGNGVLIRWASPSLYFSKGVSIYRSKTGNNEWVKLTDQPLLPPQVKPNGVVLNDEVSKIYFEDYLIRPKEELLGDFGVILLMSQSIKDFQLALAMGVAYIDETAQNGNSYEYKIEANVDGASRLIGVSAPINVAKYSTQNPPQHIFIERKKKKVEFKWEYNVDKHYEVLIYRKEGESDYQLLGESGVGTGNLNPDDGIFHVDDSIVYDTDYSYKLQARDYFGQLTEFSEEFVLKAQDFEPPVVGNIVLDGYDSEKSITISWKPVQENDVVGYNLYRGIASDTTVSRVNVEMISKADTFFVDKVENSNVYRYQLEAIDKSNNSGFSDPAIVQIHDVIPPETPMDVHVFADTGVIRISWQPNIEEDLLGYRVLRYVGENKESAMYVGDGVLDTNYFEQKLEKHVEAKFNYCVVAIDNDYNYSKPSSPMIGQLPDVTPPGKPFLKGAELEDSCITIHWVPSMDKDLMGYELYRKVVDDTSEYVKHSVNIIPKDSRVYVDRWVERGINYSYKLMAVDQTGYISEFSNSVSAKLPLLPLDGKIEVEKGQYNKSKQSVYIKWNAELIHEELLGYTTYCSINGSKPAQVSKMSTENELKLKVKDSGKYTYFIRAYGKRGNHVESEPIELEININQ